MNLSKTKIKEVVEALKYKFIEETEGTSEYEHDTNMIFEGVEYYAVGTVETTEGVNPYDDNGTISYEEFLPKEEMTLDDVDIDELNIVENDELINVF